MSAISLFYIFSCALTTSLIMIPPISHLAVRIGGIDRPDDRKVHTSETPRLGGIAIFCAFLFSVLFFVEIDRQVKAFLAGAVVIFVTGLADDLINLKPGQKLFGQILAASTAIISGGIHLTTLGDPFGLGPITFGFLAIPFTIFAVVGVMNAINLLDGLDGLAGGVSAIACLAFGVLSLKSGTTHLLPLIVALLGAVTGFLRYNTFPARIFMGDSGSLFLGYCMGLYPVMLLSRPEAGISPVTLLIILAVPVFDTLIVMLKRIKRGESISSPDKTHIHHRLLDLGFGHKFSVVLVYGVTYLLSMCAILFNSAADYILMAALVIFSMVFYAVLSALASTNLLQKYTVLRSNQPIRTTYTYRSVAGFSRYLLLIIKYLLLTLLGLALLVNPVYPRVIPVTAGLLMILTLAFFVLKKRWSNTLFQVAIYFAGAISIFVIENYGQSTAVAGFSLISISHFLFVCLFLVEGIKIFLRRNSVHLITTPFEYLILFIVVAIPMLPSHILGNFNLSIVAAKSVLLFVAYKLILMRHAKRNRKIFLMTSIALFAFVVRYLLHF